MIFLQSNASVSYSFILPSTVGGLGSVFLSGAGSGPNTWTSYAIPSSITGTTNQGMVSNGTAVTFQNIVNSFSGDGALLNNSSATGSVTATLANAGAHKWFGNNTGSSAAPSYESLTASDIPIISLSSGVSGTLGTANGGTGNTSGAVAALCAGTSANLGSATEYVGFGTNNVTESAVYLPVPVSGVAAAMHAQMSAAPSSSIGFKMRYTTGGSTSALLSCSITGGGTTVTSCDATGSTSVTEGTGNAWDVEIDNASGIGIRNYAICVKVTSSY